jgi:hypothetical protein
MDIRDLANYGGFVIGVIGIILSVYLYQKALEKKEPRCFYRTYREIEKLSSSGDSNIQILYKSKDVDRVFTSYLWLWNKGKKAINQSDIPPQSNISIVLNDKEHHSRILDYRILKASRDEINFRVTSVNDNKFSFAFDFLDYNDGAVIEIQHTGSYDTEIGTEGIILGAPKGIAVISRKSPNSVLDFYRKIFFRERVVRPTKLFVHKSFRQKFMSILSYLIMFGLLVGFLVWLNYSINTTTRSMVSITSDKLEEILVSELPQLPDQGIQNIIKKVTERSTSDEVFTYLLPAYMVIFTLMFGAMIWSEFSSPIPKSLYFKDDGETNQ